MKYEVPFRIIVNNPLAGVSMKVQMGRNEFLKPVATGGELLFEFNVRVDLGGDGPNFLGPFAQGPKDGRFIYVNSGGQAGQENTCWDRRAKLSLVSISKDIVEKALASRSARLETAIHGVGRDGGPVCASVKGLEWRIAAK